MHDGYCRLMSGYDVVMSVSIGGSAKLALDTEPACLSTKVECAGSRLRYGAALKASWTGILGPRSAKVAL